MSNYLNSETIGLHGGSFRKDDVQTSVAVPIHQTSSFQFNSTNHAANLFGLKEFGNIYTRIMNPTTNVLEERIAALEGGAASLCVSSGQAASAFVVQNLCNSGDNIIASTDLYGGTINLFNNTLKSMGIEVRYANPSNPDNFEKLSDEKLLEIKSLVQEALGFDEARGDSVTVTSSPFVDILEAEVAPWYENASVKELAQQLATVLILAIVIFGAFLPLLKRVLVPAGYSSSPGVLASDAEDDEDDKIEVQEGESLEDIKAKLKPKKAAISAEMLDTANTYDDKVAVIRMIVGDEAARVSSVFKNMMEKE